MIKKHILFFNLAAIISVLLINSNNSIYPVQVKLNTGYTADTVFKIGTYTSGYNSVYENSKSDPYNWYYIFPVFKDYGFNSSVFYSNSASYSKSGISDVIFDGGLYQNIERYKGYVGNFINFFSGRNIIGTYERGSIKTLCGSQTSTYEAEDSVYYGFYNNSENRTGGYFKEGEIKGRAAMVGNDNQGYILSGLIENAEQSDTWTAIGVGGEDDSTWYIKPKMRIDSADALKFKNTGIARIEIIDFNGNIIISYEIKGGNFLNSADGKYSGEFKEDFNPLVFKFSGGTEKGGLNHNARTDFDSTFNFKSCKVDYRIWWYGVCNLWVDYVKVEDVWAYNLFGNNEISKMYRDKIISEAMAFKESAHYFHYDEVRKNNLPSIKFVQHILDSVSDKKLKIVPIASSLNNELKNKYKDFGEYLDIIDPPYLFTDCYPFTFMGEYIDVPDRKPYQTWLPPNIRLNKKNLEFLKADYKTYTERVQYDRLGDKNSNWDATKSLKHLSFVGHLNRNIEDAISKLKTHAVTIQAHSYITEEKNGTCIGINLREPTNEEIRVQANLSLCYGVKGIYYFCFNGDKPPGTGNGSGGLQDFLNFFCSSPNEQEMIGLTYYPGSGFAVPVTSNYYGQNKFDAVKEINKKTNALGPLLMKLSWENAYSVHSEGANHNYIEDIISKFYYQNQDYPGCKINGELCDCREKRFWELGFFTDNQSESTGTRYFMAVNRRTVPDSPEGSGDVRILKIKFAKNLLNSYRIWKLTDVYTNQYIIFDAKSDDYINLESIGVFLPGEGKLFKLEPVK